MENLFVLGHGQSYSPSFLTDAGRNQSHVLGKFLRPAVSGGTIKVLTSRPGHVIKSAEIIADALGMGPETVGWFPAGSVEEWNSDQTQLAVSLIRHAALSIDHVVVVTYPQVVGVILYAYLEERFGVPFDRWRMSHLNFGHGQGVVVNDDSRVARLSPASVEAASAALAAAG